MANVKTALESYIRGMSTMTIEILTPAGEHQPPTTVRFYVDPVIGQRLAFETLRSLRRGEEYASAMRAYAKRASSADGENSTGT